MTVQLPLPRHWPRNMSRRNPTEALAEIEHDRLEAKYRLRLVLDEFAEKHGIGHKLVYGYVDDMLTNLFFDKEEEIKAEIEADIARENQ